MEARVTSMLAWDADHLIHWVIPVGMNAGFLVERGEGVSFYDSEGKKYLDGASQLTCIALGYRYNDEIADAAAQQLRRLPYLTNFWGFANPSTIECGQKLAALTPPGLDYFWFTNGGGESVETAFELSRKYWRNKGSGKYKIISLYNSYHGLYFGSASATGVAFGHFTEHYAPLVPGFVKAPSYYCYRCMLGREYPSCDIACARHLEQLIGFEGPETVAAFIAEPVHGTAGHIPAPPEYWPIVRDICSKHHVHLIADEVMTGFGRTGKAFAVDHWGVVPDMMTLAKGLTSAYLPFGAVATNEEIFAGLRGSFMGGTTYSGHPVAAAVSSKVLEIYVRDRIFEHAAEMGRYAMERLRSEFQPLAAVGDISGLGLQIGIEVVKHKAFREGFNPETGAMQGIAQKALEQGLLVRTSDESWSPGNRVSFSPPLVTTKAEIDCMLDILFPLVAELVPAEESRDAAEAKV